jgi:hypothetical protein
VKRRCVLCNLTHPDDESCIKATTREIDRLHAKIADMRGDLERIRAERDRATGRAPKSRSQHERETAASPSTRETPPATQESE